MERRRFLRDSVLASAPSVALQWLVSPPVSMPAGLGRRGVGTSDVLEIREVSRVYREMDNRLGGGRVRAGLVHYLNAEVTPLLAQGSYAAETGRELASAAAEIAQLAG